MHVQEAHISMAHRRFSHRTILKAFKFVQRLQMRLALE
jgi:hypothetical protein